jgi:hypothetical protein
MFLPYVSGSLILSLRLGALRKVLVDTLCTQTNCQKKSNVSKISEKMHDDLTLSVSGEGRELRHTHFLISVKKFHVCANRTFYSLSLCIVFQIICLKNELKSE